MVGRIKALCTDKNMSLQDLEKEISLGVNTIYKWDKAFPSVDKVQKVAAFFNVPLDYILLSEPNESYCPECGTSSLKEDECYHKKQHAKWAAASSKFGFCWPYALREALKNNGRIVLRDDSATLQERLDGAVDVLKSYFCRSLEANNYNLQHVDFETFSAMLLNQESIRDMFPADVCDKLIEKFGQKKGIENGTYFYVASNRLDSTNLQAAAAHLDLDNITDEGIVLYNNLVQMLAEKYSKK